MVVITDVYGDTSTTTTTNNNNINENIRNAEGTADTSTPEIHQSRQSNSLLYTQMTATTEQQIQTELECAHYLNLLLPVEEPSSADSYRTGRSDGDPRDYFSSRGLLVPLQQPDDDDNHTATTTTTATATTTTTATTNNIDAHNAKGTSKEQTKYTKYTVRLLREEHAQYLHTIFLNAPQHKLRPSFVSLDSSHTWMIYWCLHGLDLIGQFMMNQTTIDDYNNNVEEDEQEHERNDDEDEEEEEVDDEEEDDDHNYLTQRIIRTIQSCYTTCTVSISRDIAMNDPILYHAAAMQLQQQYQTINVDGGGFGGGIDQLPHAATTYAAVMSLCILASSWSLSHDANNKNDNDNGKKSNLALQYLLSIRTSLYIWFTSLYNPSNGSFCMHIDGEMDVRATYCIYAVLHILQMIPPTSSQSSLSSSLTLTTTMVSLFNNPRISDYIWSCQSSWEGGFGGEPGTEAHGGYTYCAIAALYLFHTHPSVVDSSSSTTSYHHRNTTQDRNNNSYKNNNNIRQRMDLCMNWLRQRQMPYEGGFSGRINKLVDGCYSFWQGAASVIMQEQLRYEQRQHHKDKIVTPDDDVNRKISIDCYEDPWVLKSSVASVTNNTVYDPVDHPAPFDASMLERYILLCTQDENGGLRDKPSKGRDFYHSCYCLSGLSISQHYGHHDNNVNHNKNDDDSHRYSDENTWTQRTHPCYNVRVEHVAFCQSYFRQYPLMNTRSI